MEPWDTVTIGRSSRSLVGGGGEIGGGGGGAGGGVSDFVASSFDSVFFISSVFCGEYVGVIDSPYEYLKQKEIYTDRKYTMLL